MFFRLIDIPNAAPTANTTSGSGTEDQEAGRIAILLSATDPDTGDAVKSFSIATLAANGQLFDAATGGNLLGAGDSVPATGSGRYTATV